MADELERPRATAEQIAAARELHQCDEVEIDDDAIISEADTGYWVQAWVWVPGPSNEVDVSEELL